jgi:dihydrofolate synthase/folylpolyglutamate synthase
VLAPRLSAVLGDLYARAPRGVRLGLEPMLAACARFGQPERDRAFVHVAGTNGKGSVTAMVESVARAAGLRTGLYTSPHLARFAERIRIDGVPLDDARLVAIVGEVLQREPELSFFEVATLAALLAFREARVDLAVLEVGLGGRLDATNVVPAPRVCAVTRIAFDHMEHLGASLELIAGEKAAIAKPGAPMILGVLPDDLASVIERIARERGASPVRAADDAEARAFRQRASLALGGEHQKDNAMLAWAIARALGIDAATSARGIERATWPGRLERIDGADGPVLFDAAHNPDGAAALAAALAGRDRQETALVFGTLADKDWRAMLDVLAPAASVRAYAKPKGRAATDPMELARRHAGETFTHAADAFAHARAAVGAEGLVVVCGSISLVGELRAALLGEAADPPVAL